jgi:hypothetical protein
MFLFLVIKVTLSLQKIARKLRDTPTLNANTNKIEVKSGTCKSLPSTTTQQERIPETGK